MPNAMMIVKIYGSNFLLNFIKKIMLKSYFLKNF
jgi:hypothetical protein